MVPTSASAVFIAVVLGSHTNVLIVKANDAAVDGDASKFGGLRVFKWLTFKL